MKKQPKLIMLHPNDVISFRGVCGKVWRLLNPETAPVKALSTALIEIEAGKRSTPHFHRVIEEIYFILRGEGLLDIDGIEYPVTQNTIVYIPPKATHSIVNGGKLRLRLLVIDHPPYTQTDTYCLSATQR